MSILYLATGPLPLAAKLAENLDQPDSAARLFQPAQIVVPHRYLEKWLQLWIARRQGIAINLRFQFLENVLWKMLRAVDPQSYAAVPRLLGADTYQLLVLAALLGEDEPDLASLQKYFRAKDLGGSRRSWRRAWHLAAMLSNLIRDYEYHRQDTLINPWIVENRVTEEERSQAAVFLKIIRPDGLRARLNEKTGRNFKTLPQYAQELLEILQKSTAAATAPADGEDMPLGSTVHLFGLTQISALHVSTLHWLSHFFDLRIYHLNPLVARLPSSFRSIVPTAERYRQDSPTKPDPVGDELLQPWARAGAESFWLMGQLTKPFAQALKGKKSVGARFQVQIIAEEPLPRPDRGSAAQAAPETVLARLQQQLLGQPPAKERLPQDTSLQIAGCPGTRREVETVYHSILWNLQKQPDLKLTDIAVLVTDMNLYRPSIQAVFDQQPCRLPYNLMDYSAAGFSIFGQALLGLVDLALEPLTRTRVFKVLLNPCFLARLGASRAEALTWLRWARELGIYQGWDSQDKKECGYAASSRYGWRQGLRRLRLGRFMEVTSDDSRPAPRFGDIIPFADLDSQDPEQLDAFSRAVERLLPLLIKLRTQKLGGQGWAKSLRRLINDYLDIPADRPEEAQVRDKILAGLEQWTCWDHLRDDAPVPLAVMREFLSDNLAAIEGHQGNHFSGGITIAALAPMRAVPFAQIYVLGLGESLFPGAARLPSLDLRRDKRRPGDVLPGEYARYLFLETLLAARQKIYLLYNNRDLAKDQALLPAIPLQQLERYLNLHVLQTPLKTADVRIHDHDAKTVTTRVSAAYDVGSRVSETERLLALIQAKKAGLVTLDPSQEKDFQKRLCRKKTDFTLPAPSPTEGRGNGGLQVAVPTIPIKDLCSFLENPALAALKRHLLLVDGEEDEMPPDDEPFVSSKASARRITRHVLESFITDSVTDSLEQALNNWPQRFGQFYEDEGLRCRVPEGGFGIADREYLREQLQNRITGPLADFLRGRQPGEFCGPVLLGHSPTPVGPRRRFPPLTLTLPRVISPSGVDRARLCGFMPLVWDHEENLEMLVVTTAKLEEKCLSKHLFEPVLFYLALLANQERNPDGSSSREWLASKKLRVYVCWKEGMPEYTYTISPAEAVAYLQDLVADFLTPTFDHLPFKAIAGLKTLRAAFEGDDASQGDLPQRFASCLEEKVAEASESDYGGYWQTPLLDLAKPEVPDDAYDKIRRRFRLLNRGPAELRGGAFDNED